MQGVGREGFGLDGGNSTASAKERSAEDTESIGQRVGQGRGADRTGGAAIAEGTTPSGLPHRPFLGT